MFDKVNAVRRFIFSNPYAETRLIVDMFKLDWSLNADLGNGIGKIGFYTDASQRFLCFEIYDSIGKWFR